MIWDPQHQVASANSPMVDALILQMAEILSTCGQMQEEEYADVAYAVEVALSEQDEVMDAGALALLAARAIHGLGYGEAASRLYVLGGGIVRPTCWALAGEETVWTLNMDRLARASDLSLEIGFRRTVLGVLDTIAYVWDETDGAGVFGLERLRPVSPRPRAGRPAKRRSDELVKMCELKLAKIAERRGWPFRPQVIRVEL